ncbi:hypothetical protein ABG067_006590 [Albugo candida]
MLKYGKSITMEQQMIPKKTFAVMGALDGFSGILQVFAATYLGGSILILLGQAAIPISMVISSIWLHTQYTNSQYFGAGIVTFGLIIVLGPNLSLAASNLQAFDFLDLETSNSFAWALVMILSCIPMCLSSVYKEKHLGEAEMDAIYLNGWVAIYQFIICLPLTIPIAMLGSPSVSPSELPSNLWNGFRCYLGHNSIYEEPYPDDCSRAPVYVTIYLFFNILYNILIIFILKFGSSNILYLAMTIMVPLGNVAFTFPFMPGHEPLASKDIFGLILIMLGLFVYRFFGELISKTMRSTRAQLFQECFDDEDILKRRTGEHSSELTEALIASSEPNERDIRVVQI